jgi:hypothetical protein
MGRCATSPRTAWKTSKGPSADLPARCGRGQQLRAVAARPAQVLP